MSPGEDNLTAAGVAAACHIVAMPYPGRGHINPMMNLCHSLLSKHPQILITFVVTEEWLHLIDDSDKPAAGFQFVTIPNVIPSELVRAKDFKGFIEAVYTKLQTPFEKVLDELNSPVKAIIADTYLPWICDVGTSRGIPVASLWTMSATVFTVFHHFDLLRQHRHFPIDDFSEIEEEMVDYIPGLPPTRILDIQPFIARFGVVDKALESVRLVPKLQYLLFTSPYELEPKLFDALKTQFRIPIYPVGPSIPYMKLDSAIAPCGGSVDYFRWLDVQPKGSVLYISMGSFLSASQSQTEEIVVGILSSGVRFLLVARGEAMVSAAAAGSSGGMVVPWCDQLRVLCHESIGGFWTHCGMNSTMEGVYAGVPMLCWPLFMDQFTNCKAIVEDLGVGWRVKRRNRGGAEELVKREEVAEVVKRFMDGEEKNGEVAEMRKRASKLREVCRAAVADASYISHGTINDLTYQTTNQSSSSENMFSGQENPTAGDCHIVAMPYPGRGHINPMMNLCHTLLSKYPKIMITFVVTEEWLHLLGETAADGGDKNIRFATVPNVIPSELVRAKDYKGFVEAVCTKLRGPFDELLDGLPSPVTAIIADTYLPWMCEVGSSRGIPVASLWTMPATVFAVFLHFDLLRQHRHFPFPDFSGVEEEKVDYIPGLSPTRILDLQPFIDGLGPEVLDFAIESVSLVSKVQYLLFTSPCELEPKLVNALKSHFRLPVYPIGPSIPHLKLPADDSSIVVASNLGKYFSWLDAQPRGSVLYISMGSFLSASESQTKEIVAGVVSSGVRFLLIARGEAMVSATACAAGGGGGMVVSWCDQLKVLCHDSIGGFWTHCGMNSTMESLYAGVPMLCWPLFFDQFMNCKAIVEDWRVGWRARRRNKGGAEEMVRREEIAEMVKRFMDAEEESGEVGKMRKRALKLREAFRATVADD
ncbi:UDP-glycosyltransferase 87A2 [Linum perenne]